MKAPVVHDGYLRVARRVLGWGAAVAVLCLAPRLASFVVGHSYESVDRVRRHLANIQNTLRTYREKTGSWPAEATWSAELINQRLLEQEPMDPWDHPFRYQLESTDGGDPEPRLTSVGRDGIADTEDDVELVEKRRP